MKSIKELSKEFNISSRTIRYYEELFDLNSIKKSNVRYYDDEEIKKIKIIVVFRKLNFSLDKIKKLMLEFNQENILNIINEEKVKYLKQIKETTNYFVLLNELKTLITNTTDDSLEEFVINELFDDYKGGKDCHINERTEKQHQIINTFFEMIKNKDILPFKEYCHEKIELIGFQDFILNTLKLDETLIDYRINSEYSLFNGSVFVVVNTKNEKMTLKIVFNTDDIVIGIWIVEFTKHNS
ncbi:MAG: MerR family transcriptional regulator [Bacilli bacterium]|nr:MerR family transcriptional regulator [Bacilli bacterium]